MLRKLGSPKRSSRFAAASTASDSKELNALAAAAEAPSPKSRRGLFSSDPKVPTGDAQAENKSNKKNENPQLPTERPGSTSADPQTTGDTGTDVPALALGASSKAAAATSHGDRDDRKPALPSPLVRTPRQKSIVDEGVDDAKPSPSPSPSPPKTKPKGKRNSLAGLKSLVAKRDKSTKENAKSIKDQGDDNATNAPRTNKTKPIPAAATGGDGDAMEPALSPIRRKPRQPLSHESDPYTQTTSSTTTATIREATSLLARKKTLPSGIPPLQQPELHIIGEIVGGDGFGKPSDGFCCKWSVDYGTQWIHIAGDQLGQTQIDYADSSPPHDGNLTWSHPLDLHFATTVFHGWPKLLLQVWRMDSHMSMHVVGYGFVHIPFTPGHHRLTVAMWRPMGSSKEELEASLLGHTTELTTDEVLFNTAWAERCRLKTIATGRVHIDLGVMLRNFDTSKMDM